MRLKTLVTNLKLEAYILHNEGYKNDTDLEISSKTFFLEKCPCGKIFIPVYMNIPIDSIYLPIFSLHID